MKDPAEMYVKFPMSLMSIQNISMTEFKILALVVTFGKKGLKMQTERIAEIFKVTPTHVSRSLTHLEKKGRVKIEKKQSPYRRVYLTEMPIPLQPVGQSGNGSASTYRADYFNLQSRVHIK